MTLFVRNFLLIIVLNLMLTFQNYILSENISSTLLNLLACKSLQQHCLSELNVTTISFSLYSSRRLL